MNGRKLAGVPSPQGFHEKQEPHQCERSYHRALFSRNLSLVGLIAASVAGLAGIIIFIVSHVQAQEKVFPYGEFVSRTSINSELAAVPISLLIVFLVTLCNESLGFIHTISLRWALWHEGRLRFNSNLRLLTRSRSFGCNSWPANIVWVFFAALSYAAASQILFGTPEVALKSFLQGKQISTPTTMSIPDYVPVQIFSLYSSGGPPPGVTAEVPTTTSEDSLGTRAMPTMPLSCKPAPVTSVIAINTPGCKHIPANSTSAPPLLGPSQYITFGLEANLLAILALGIGLLGQAAIATWALFSMTRRLTSWSSNPINNALVCCLGSLKYNIGCHMVPERKPGGSDWNTSKFNITRVSSLAGLRRFAFNTTIALWLVSFATLTWASCIQGIGNSSDDSFAGEKFPSAFNGGKKVCFKFTPTRSAYWAKYLIGILLTLIIQGPFTVVLHCTELLVNAARDETVWRSTSNLRKGGGADLNASAIKEALSSWETATLFLLKTIVHWAFGEAISYSWGFGPDLGVCLVANALWVLASMMFLSALFGTYLCFRQPPGRQPVTYGHFQTIVNLVDDWGSDTERLFWGDKEHVGWDAEGEIRRTGSAGNPKSLRGLQDRVKYIF